MTELPPQGELFHLPTVEPGPPLPQPEPAKTQGKKKATDPRESERNFVSAGAIIALYRPELGDAVEFLLRCSASAELHHPYVYPPSTYAAFAAYLQRLADGRHLGFLLRRLEDRSLVGVINLNELVRGGFHSAYLGFYGFVPFNGKGYMTEGLRLVLRYCFRTLRLHRLEANVQPGNLPSLALVRRCAFRHEGFSPHYLKINGRWRDHERFALTREDWAGKLDREFGNA